MVLIDLILPVLITNFVLLRALEVGFWYSHDWLRSTMNLQVGFRVEGLWVEDQE